MTSPLKVDTEELIQLANGHEQLVEVLSGGGGPPQVKVMQDFPSTAAADAALGAARAAKDRQAARLGANAGALRATAGAYQQQEGQSRGQLGEAVKMGEIAGLVQAVIGPLAQFGGQGLGAFATMAQAGISAAATPAIGLIGALSNASATMDGHPHPANIGPSSGLLGPEGDGTNMGEPGPPQQAHLRSEHGPAPTQPLDSTPHPHH